ncbi:MAG: prepilin-type N-terminal cleavage/methylation domain-containing protein [Phycisphaerales bacterium]|nr:prepilin-type N-terminal cleavage/methylation domain-containing protein [Phycisphaerales bacterium]
MKRHRRPPLSSAPARAFTITELLVVISLFAILLAVAVPSFSAMLQSSEESLADGQLRTGLAAGRDAAVRSDSGDGAAVFFYEPGGRTRIVACVHVATITDVRDGRSPTSSNPDDFITREVFAPLPAVKPVELPRGWMVRGLVSPGRLQAAVTSSTATTDLTTGWYEPNPGKREFEDPDSRPNWVFPETGFYDYTKGDTGRTRQTFMVRYARGTGAVMLSDQKPVIVLDPVPAQNFRKAGVWQQFPIEKAPDLATYARRLTGAWSGSSPLGSTLLQQDQRRRQLIGDTATDTVLAGPVTAVALYQEKRLAAGLKVTGLNKATGSLYGSRDLGKGTDIVPREPMFDPKYFKSEGGAGAKKINDWIQGRDPYKSEARLYTLNRYLGSAREITP